MRRRRVSRHFRQLGELPAERLGLSARRVRELELIRAWRRVAGQRWGALARPIRVRRGSLELELFTAEPGLRQELEQNLGQLVPELARRLPALRIQRIRVADAQGRAAAGSAGGRRPEEDERFEAPGSERPRPLRELAERYLARARGQKPVRTVSSQASRSEL